MTSGQRASASQRSAEDPTALRAQHNGKNLRAEQMKQMGGNPMAIRIQQMGVNLEIKVVRSHMLTSRGVNVRSSLGKNFRRLGCETDLRDTLNRRSD